MVKDASGASSQLYLLVRVRARLCAIPLEHVEETMRPQPVRAMLGAPQFVLGMALIRGIGVPVVDAASALEGQSPAPAATRFVALKTGDRRVALAVDQVLGVRRIDLQQLSDLPPLLASAREQVVSAIGTLDSELLMVLRSGKLVPDEVWPSLTARSDQ